MYSPDISRLQTGQLPVVVASGGFRISASSLVRTSCGNSLAFSRHFQQFAFVLPIALLIGGRFERRRRKVAPRAEVRDVIDSGP
jgi:hypothetical protein